MYLNGARNKLASTTEDHVVNKSLQCINVIEQSLEFQLINFIDFKKSFDSIRRIIMEHCQEL